MCNKIAFISEDYNIGL